LDATVLSAFTDTPEHLQHYLQTRLGDVPDPSLGRLPRMPRRSDNAVQAPIDPLECEGTVGGVHGDEITLYVEGVTPDEGSTISIPPGMPGFLCRPGTEFRVTLNDSDDLYAGQYSLHTHEWASEDELLDGLKSRYGH